MTDGDSQRQSSPGATSAVSTEYASVNIPDFFGGGEKKDENGPPSRYFDLELEAQAQAAEMRALELAAADSPTSGSAFTSTSGMRSGSGDKRRSKSQDGGSVGSEESSTQPEYTLEHLAAEEERECRSIEPAASARHQVVPDMFGF